MTMGGLPCLVDRQATLRFKTVPTSPADQAAFDAQIRILYASPNISQSIVNDVPDSVQTCCNILGQATFSQADRQKLLDTLNKLWPGYS
jgi:hypothetical protein